MMAHILRQLSSLACELMRPLKSPRAVVLSSVMANTMISFALGALVSSLLRSHSWTPTFADLPPRYILLRTAGATRISMPPNCILGFRS